MSTTPRFADEVRRSARLAAPLAAGHLSHGLVGFVDAVVAGRALSPAGRVRRSMPSGRGAPMGVGMAATYSNCILKFNSDVCKFLSPPSRLEGDEPPKEFEMKKFLIQNLIICPKEL